MAGLRKGRDRRTVGITREWQTKSQVTESTKCPCEEWGFYPVNNGEPLECREKSGEVGWGVGQRAVILPEPGVHMSTEGLRNEKGRTQRVHRNGG